jgi:dTDP-4-dehydrorhamnose reductase
MRVAVTGVGGLVGSNLALACWARGHEVLGTYGARATVLPSIATRSMDVADGRAVGEALGAFSPEVAFHLAAMTHPDACALDPARCREVNVLGTRRVAEAARAGGAKVVFTSTDLVFDGTGSWYREEDVPRPLGEYARSKLAAEAEVLGAEVRGCVVRSALVYGWGRAHGRSFAEGWLGRLRRGEALEAFADQWRCPVWVEDLCGALLDIALCDLRGVYHVAGPERCTRYEFAVALAEEFGIAPGLVRPGSAAEARLLDPRPRDVSMRIDKLRAAAAYAPRGVRDGLRRMRAIEGSIP